MSSSFICARTGASCTRQKFCEIANEPLVGAVKHIAQEVTGGPGRRLRYAGVVLTSELARVGETMLVDFAPTADGPDAAICPRELLERGLRGRSIEQIAQGIAFMAAKAVQDTITDLNLRETRRSKP